MFKKKWIILVLFIFSTVIFGQADNKMIETVEDKQVIDQEKIFEETKENPKIRAMILRLERTRRLIEDFINIIQEKSLQNRLRRALDNTRSVFTYFEKQVENMTKNMATKSLIIERRKLAKSFDILLNKRFEEIDGVISKTTTLEDYRVKNFEKMLYVFLKARLHIYYYHLLLAEQKVNIFFDEEKNKEEFVQDAETLNNRIEGRLRTISSLFESYVEDIEEFNKNNRELYRENSVFIKQVILIEDNTQIGTFYDKNEKVIGDVAVLIDFLKGKFKDYRGLFTKVVSFRQTEVREDKKGAMIFLMKYQPIPNNAKIDNIFTVDVTVTGSDLEQIMTAVLNQASQIADMRVASEMKKIEIKAENINYNNLKQENLALSRVAVLRAVLQDKREIKPDKEQEEKGITKILEVTLRLTIGRRR